MIAKINQLLQEVEALKAANAEEFDRRHRLLQRG